MIKPIVLAADEAPVSVASGGKAFGIYFAHFPVKVVIKHSEGCSTTHENVGSGFFCNGSYDDVAIVSSYAQTIKVLTGGSDSVYQQMSAVDLCLERVLAGCAFLGDNNVSAVAAQYSHLQLYNPVDSGYWLSVDQMGWRINAVQSMGLVIDNTALSTLHPDAIAFNQLSGGANDTVAQIRRETNASKLIGATASTYRLRLSEANIDHTFSPKRPIVLKEGQGLTLICHTVNTGIFGTFDYSILAAGS